MKSFGLIAVLAAALMAAPVFAQEAPAAAGSMTVHCKDGTTQTVTTTKGACRGHKGIDKSAGSSAASSTPAAAPAAAAPAATPSRGRRFPRSTGGPLCWRCLPAPFGDRISRWTSAATRRSPRRNRHKSGLHRHPQILHAGSRSRKRPGRNFAQKRTDWRQFEGDRFQLEHHQQQPEPPRALGDSLATSPAQVRLRSRRTAPRAHDPQKPL